MYKAVAIGIFMAFAMVILCLSLILDSKTAFWTSLGIPFSLLFCFAGMSLLNIDFHFIILFTFIIITGMLVDDAIIVAEKIYSLKEAGHSPLEATLKGATELIGPILTIVSTTILGFLPILFLPGPLGKFLADMPLIIALCLIGSLIECFFIFCC